MERLFVSDSLNYPNVQEKVFGRPIPGHTAVLRGHRRFKIRLDQGEDYVVEPSSPERKVRGNVLNLTEEQLKKADDYEKSDSHRGVEKVKVHLNNGHEAWAYRRNPATSG